MTLLRERTALQFPSARILDFGGPVTVSYITRCCCSFLIVLAHEVLCGWMKLFSLTVHNQCWPFMNPFGAARNLSDSQRQILSKICASYHPCIILISRDLVFVTNGLHAAKETKSLSHFNQCSIFHTSENVYFHVINNGKHIKTLEPNQLWYHYGCGVVVTRY